MLERVENIKQYSKYDLLQMIKVSLVRDKFAAMEFLKLCYKKKRNMRKIVNNIEYIYVEKNNCEIAVRYVNILLRRLENGIA
ncbi:MAG: hypothetical protein HFJ29_08375 [Clostridia bacterium]|jgi:hypothetical protein|nr:hypothetical protein [Clostridia bacterium]